MLFMEGKCRNMSRVRVYLTHLLPELRKIQKTRSSVTQRQQAIRFAADMCLARTGNNGSAWIRALNLRLLRKEKIMTTMKMKKSSLRRSRIITLARRMRLASLNPKYCNNIVLETGGHDNGAVDSRLGTLQRIVPGGRKMGVNTLFQETADYMLNLQMQVQAMEALADFYTQNSPGRVDESVAQQQLSASCAAHI